MTRSGGLGRGLASLIPQKKQEPQQEDPEQNKTKESQAQTNFFGSSNGKKEKTGEEGKYFVDRKFKDASSQSVIEVEVDQIESNPHQPRKNFDEEKLSQLAESIKKHGILQPIMVSRKNKDGYELIAGERRLEAAKIAGLEKVPVLVRKVDEQSKMELALVENIQRHNLNPVEEARAYKKMRDSFALTQEEIALRMGKSRSTIANNLRLLSLPVEIQNALISGKITEGHARSIVALPDEQRQRALFEMILKNKMSVREVEEKVRKVTVEKHVRKVRAVDPDTIKREEELAQSLGTKVKIKKGKGGGQIIIEYYSDDDFDALVARLQ